MHTKEGWLGRLEVGQVAWFLCGLLFVFVVLYYFLGCVHGRMVSFRKWPACSCPGLSCRSAVPCGSSSFGFGGFALCFLIWDGMLCLTSDLYETATVANGRGAEMGKVGPLWHHTPFCNGHNGDIQYIQEKLNEIHNCRVLGPQMHQFLRDQSSHIQQLTSESNAVWYIDEMRMSFLA